MKMPSIFIAGLLRPYIPSTGCVEVVEPGVCLRVDVTPFPTVCLDATLFTGECGLRSVVLIHIPVVLHSTDTGTGLNRCHSSSRSMTEA